MEEVRVLLRNIDKINPVSAIEYMEEGGYEGLKKSLWMSELDIIHEITESTLKGRGGAGFPTGIKLSHAHNARSKNKFVLCNADEGEPGTNKDRILLSKDPNSIFEGMAIAARAIGANKGYIYLRAEYPYIVPVLEQALINAREAGCLGENIFGSEFSFDIEIRPGGGAYVCGEESAMIESMEGKRGEPRFRPPYPTVQGLFQEPTAVFNVETLANIGPIMHRGADWYKTMGTKKSHGTKLYTISGNVRNKGVYEFEVGVNLKDLIYEAGGGIPNGKKLLAVQTGGTAGAIINKHQINMPMDPAYIADSGGSMGAGDVLVIDNTNDIVDILDNVLSFFVHESCGKCTPCREGSMRLYQLVSGIIEGTTTSEGTENIRELCETMRLASLCGLGQSVPIPVLSCLDNFREIFDEYIVRNEKNKKMAAGGAQ